MSFAAAARLRLRQESGITLLEMLVSLAVGTVVMLAGFGLIDMSFNFSARIFDRSDASQLARMALSHVTQELHSSCVAGGITPIQSGSDGSHLSFLSGYGSGATITPTLHKVAFAGGALTDTTYASIGGSAPSWSFATQPSAGVTVATHVTQAAIGSPAVTVPVFSYYGYTAGELSSTAMTTPLTTASAAAVAEVTIAFGVGPSSGSTAAGRLQTVDDSVVLRLSPASPTSTGPCS